MALGTLALAVGLEARLRVGVYELGIADYLEAAEGFFYRSDLFLLSAIFGLSPKGVNNMIVPFDVADGNGIDISGYVNATVCITARIDNVFDDVSILVAWAEVWSINQDLSSFLLGTMDINADSFRGKITKEEIKGKEEEGNNTRKKSNWVEFCFALNEKDKLISSKKGRKIALKLFWTGKIGFDVSTMIIIGM
jgi:hypothetical protein